MWSSRRLRTGWRRRRRGGRGGRGWCRGEARCCRRWSRPSRTGRRSLSRTPRRTERRPWPGPRTRCCVLDRISRRCAGFATPRRAPQLQSSRWRRTPASWELRRRQAPGRKCRESLCGSDPCIPGTLAQPCGSTLHAPASQGAPATAAPRRARSAVDAAWLSHRAAPSSRRRARPGSRTPPAGRCCTGGQSNGLQRERETPGPRPPPTPLEDESRRSVWLVNRCCRTRTLPPTP
mmetsp:Transcript_25463/g.48135  ORF Transcript_25463/g.48135 Transcript_25463/m.48135 type:complete len:234 (-) Transcript_25463:803-1504(-)